MAEVVSGVIRNPGGIYKSAADNNEPLPIQHIVFKRDQAEKLPYQIGERVNISLAFNDKRYLAGIRAAENSPFIWISPDLLDDRNQEIKLAEVLLANGYGKNQKIKFYVDGNTLTVISVDAFKVWLMKSGLTESTALKYAGAVDGVLSEWGLSAGVIKEPLPLMVSYKECANAAEKIKELPLFLERNERGHNMYSNALSKFGDFLRAAGEMNLERDVAEIVSDSKTTDTEKTALITARVGQGKFRKDLIDFWGGCAITGYQDTAILVASHIKPWAASNHQERLDVYNGLLLLPTLDKLFDQGYISFQASGKIIISKLLNNPKRLGVQPDIRLRVEDRHQGYLKYHREKRFQDGY